MTEEEKIICKQFLNDADKTHSCNEYKLLMALLEQEPTTKNETLVSLGAYKQVAWERDIAIEQLHELGYEFGEKINCDTCVYSKETDGSSCYECIKGMKNNYKPATEDNAIVNKFDKAINQSDLEEWIIETFPDWCEGDVRLILNHMDKMHPVVCPYCEKLIGV